MGGDQRGAGPAPESLERAQICRGDVTTIAVGDGGGFVIGTLTEAHASRGGGQGARVVVGARQHGLNNGGGGGVSLAQGHAEAQRHVGEVGTLHVEGHRHAGFVSRRHDAATACPAPFLIHEQTESGELE